MKITKSLNKFLILTEPIFALDPLMCEQDSQPCLCAQHDKTEQGMKGRVSIYCSVLLNLQLIFTTKSRIMDDLQMLYIVMRRCEGLNVSQGVTPNSGVGTRAGGHTLGTETSTRMILGRQDNYF